MATPNWKLDKVAESDYVTAAFDKVNTAIDAIDEIGYDCVQETGWTLRDGSQWHWTIWRSGKMELYCERHEFESKTMSQIGSTGLYQTEALTFGDYPVNFCDTPTPIVTFLRNKANNDYGGLVKMVSEGSRLTSPTFTVVGWHDGQIVPVCGLYVVGSRF